MICKNPPKRSDGKSSFADLMKYINVSERQNKNEKTLFTATLNMDSGENFRHAVAEMQSLADENLNYADPVFHAVLSWRENEQPTREEYAQAVRIYLREMNMEHCKVFYGVHKNTDNYHLYLCINKIDPDTYRTIQPANGWTKKANERAAHRVAEKIFCGEERRAEDFSLCFLEVV